jgi:hypothetical protein
MVHIVDAVAIVDHYWLMFNRGVVHIVLAVILLTITVWCLTEERFILLWLVILLPITVSMFNRGVVHIVVAGYIVAHYYLMFNRRVFHIVVAVIFLTITVSCLTEEWFILFWLVILLTINV